MNPLRLSLIVLFVLPSALAAQGGVSFSAGGGFTLPRGDVTAEHGAGLNFVARTTFQLSPLLALRGGVDYRELRRKDDPAIRWLGHDPDEFRLGGGFLDGRHHRTLAGLAHLQLMLRPREASAWLYLLAGGGVARTEVGRLGVYFLNHREWFPGETTWAPAADLGAGLAVELGRNVRLFGEASYLTFFEDDGNTTMIPVQIGLSVDPAILR